MDGLTVMELALDDQHSRRWLLPVLEPTFRVMDSASEQSGSFKAFVVEL